MTAETPARRKKTAREVAQKVECSPRTIRRIVAEPRDDFLKRSRARQDLALQLKDAGLKYREIGERLNCSEKAAQNLVHRARERHAKPSPAQA